jgi:hypothetical protein
MFTVRKTGPNRLDLEFSGKLDADGMRTALDELIAQSAGIEHGYMLYRLADFDWPSLGALGVELARLPELFRLINRFDRVAVLAEQSWIQKASEIEGALLPGVEVRAFDLDAQAAAEAWLASAPSAPR